MELARQPGKNEGEGAGLVGRCVLTISLIASFLAGWGELCPFTPHPDSHMC
jgi:hypothetical protein